MWAKAATPKCLYVSNNPICRNNRFRNCHITVLLPVRVYTSALPPCLKLSTSLTMWYLPEQPYPIPHGYKIPLYRYYDALSNEAKEQAQDVYTNNPELLYNLFQWDLWFSYHTAYGHLKLHPAARPAPPTTVTNYSNQWGMVCPTRRESSPTLLPTSTRNLGRWQLQHGRYPDSDTGHYGSRYLLTAGHYHLPAAGYHPPYLPPGSIQKDFVLN